MTFRGIPANREFPHKLTINQATALPVLVETLSLFDAHPLLHNKRIIPVRSPLLVERGDAMLAAIRDHIPNPLSLYGPSPTTTFPTRYEPIWERTMGR